MSIILDITTGTRTVCNTDWPVSTIVTRDVTASGRPQWRVTRGVCNGVADGSTVYRTRRAAIESVNP